MGYPFQPDDPETDEISPAKLADACTEMFLALMATEKAETVWANCDDCEDSGAESPELGCERCFELADRARVMRRAVIVKVLGTEAAEAGETKNIKLARYAERLKNDPVLVQRTLSELGLGEEKAEGGK